jgi:alkanesulfonate monooxygenase SsuD/methylene tetrahydromethanopterin reductase-like flavin-dependent oxidoreductase (luciferase family)
VKFHWFHLMPYPDLPEDFRERYRGVWVDPPASELFDRKRGNEIYNEYLDELEYAAEVGFDGICVNEHHQNAYGLMPSPNIMAGSLARRTRNAKIVLMGNSVALYNPPIRVAEEMAMLDSISGGRIVAGFPVGTPMDSTYCYGMNPATLRERYREAIDLILKAWTSEQPFAYNGKYTQLRYVNIWPRTVQEPHPPVWVPGAGSVETWDMCVENNFLYAYLSYFGFERGRKNFDGYWETVDKHGAERNPYRAGFLQFIGVAEDDAEAKELYAEPALYFYNRCLHMYPGFATPPGYATIPTIRRGLQSTLAHAAAQREFANLTWEDIIERGYVVAGSPDKVAQKINEMADVMNVGHLMVLMHYGNMSKETVMYNTRRFAEDVIPQLRDRFSEYEDHWWPATTLEDPARPAPLTPSAVA